MNTYVTGSTIKQLRETRNLTQAELAKKNRYQQQNCLQVGDRQGAAGYQFAAAFGPGFGNLRH